MKFKDESEKRKFVETMLSKGIDEAKWHHVSENNKIIIVETGKTVDLMGEKLTAAEVAERYPDSVMIEMTKEETDV